MANSADIAVSSSNYTGNAALGGGVIDAIKIDTTPIQNLAYYTMLYNRSEYDQRQKDAEKAASEIASMTSFNLNTGIPKDAKVLQQKYDELTKYVRENPDAVNYRNKEQWAEYNKKLNDLKNDIQGAKVRDALYQVRLNEISAEPNVEKKKLLQQRLDEEVDQTNVRQPLKHTQKYDVSIPPIPTPTAVEFDVYKQGANEDQRRDYNMLNVRKAREMGNVYGLDLDSETIDMSTPQGQDMAIARKSNFWIQGAEQLNIALQSPAYKTQDGILDKTKIKGVTKQIVDLIDKTNEYLSRTRDEIKAGVFKDKFGKPITFGQGLLREEDYAEINYQDGISPDELALVAQYAAWKGDGYKTVTIKTDNALQRGHLAVAQKNAETARINATKSDTPTTETTEDEAQRRMNDFVTNYENWKNQSGGQTKAPTNVMDEYAINAITDFDPTGKTIEIVGDNIIVYDAKGTRVKTISKDGAKTKVFDVIAQIRTKGEEAAPFGANKGNKPVQSTPSGLPIFRNQ